MTSSPLVLRGLRGATTCTENSTEAIHAAVSALMDALVDRNGLTPDQLVSVTFSVTADLDACFPAAIARRRPGWDTVALLDCQQMAVQGDLPAASVSGPRLDPAGPATPVHPYQGDAQRLRPDRSGHN